MSTNLVIFLTFTILPSWNTKSSRIKSALRYGFIIDVNLIFEILCKKSFFFTCSSVISLIVWIKQTPGVMGLLGKWPLNTEWSLFNCIVTWIASSLVGEIDWIL